METDTCLSKKCHSQHRNDSWLYIPAIIIKKGGILIKWHVLFKFPASELGQTCTPEPAHGVSQSSFSLHHGTATAQHSPKSTGTFPLLTLYKAGSLHCCAEIRGVLFEHYFSFYFLGKSFSQYCNVFNKYFKTIKSKLAKRSIFLFSLLHLPRTSSTGQVDLCHCQ